MNFLPFLLKHQANDEATSGHKHRWEHRSHQSCNSVTRYQCSICHRWGNRRWGSCGRRVPPIVAYAATSTVPLAKWGTDDSTWAHLTPKSPRVLEPENRFEFTPPLRMWRWE